MQYAPAFYRSAENDLAGLG